MIIGYFGTRGKGKTLSLIREAYNHYLDGYKIYTNIKLNKKYFKSYEILSLKDIIDFVQNEKQFHKAFFILDEIHVYIDSRASASKKNVIISYFALQTRKRNVRLGYTTQFVHQVDKRLRDLTEVEVICENVMTSEGRIQVNFVRDIGRGIIINDKYIASDFFDYYDTNEIVNPFKK